MSGIAAGSHQGGRLIAADRDDPSALTAIYPEKNSENEAAPSSWPRANKLRTTLPDG